MALITPSTGGGLLMLVGGVIQDDKAYYFQILLGDALLYNITNEDIDEIVKFNHSRNPKEVLDLLKDFINDDIPSSYFKDYIQNNLDNYFDDLPKIEYSLPEAQDRN